MDFKRIKELVAYMEEARLRRLVIKEEGFEVELERDLPMGGGFVHAAPPAAHAAAPVAPPTPTQPLGDYIKSPMVGTFYAAASPNDPPFVKVGDRVEEGKVVCIIEAMKVMNEVKASASGTIAEVLMKNGGPVEFGTKLFRIT